MFSLPFKVHLALRGHKGFDIVGLFQGFHPHIIVDHQMNMLQISPGKTVFRYLSYAAILGVAVTEHLQKNSTYLAFSLTAVSLDNHHALSLITGNQTVSNEFLKCQDIFRIQQFIQKMQPTRRWSCVRVKADRKTTPHDLVFLRIEAPVQQQHSISQMNPVILRRQAAGIRRDFHQFHQVGNLFGYIGMHERMDGSEDHLFQNRMII